MIVKITKIGRELLEKESRSRSKENALDKAKQLDDTEKVNYDSLNHLCEMNQATYKLNDAFINAIVKLRGKNLIDILSQDDDRVSLRIVLEIEEV